VTGIVQSDMAVKIRRARPMTAKTRAVQQQELRFGRRMLRKRSNRRLTEVDFKRLEIYAPQLNSDWSVGKRRWSRRCHRFVGWIRREIG
jgi:hypothetical protein